MTKQQGEDEALVSEVELEHGINAGIRQRVLTRGLVSVFEEHTARLERGIRLSEWGEMDEMEKALIVADRRIRIATRNLQTEAEIAQAERKARRAKHG